MKNSKHYGERIWKLERNLVSDGFDKSLEILSEWLPIKICKYESGSEALSWLIPPKWECQKAELRNINGEIIFSKDKHPLHVVSYSEPFKGEVKREELFDHLYTQPDIPDAIPFRFKYYTKTWGLCCSENQKKALKDAKYFVDIISSKEKGNLKVGEIIKKGSCKKEFIFVAHLCHPHQFNDDLSGVLMGMEIMDWLSQLETKYSYRFLIVPETIGSICWISNHTEELKNCIGGAFLEMTGTHENLALQKSYRKDSFIDFIFESEAEKIKDSLVGDFRKIVGNDEKQFNAPGVRKDFVSVSRARPESGKTTRHFVYYHTNKDTINYCNWENYAETFEFTKNCIKRLESEKLVKNKFEGEIFMSRYNLFEDKFINPRMNQITFDIMYEIDGTKSSSMIAKILNLPVETVEEIINKFCMHNLVELI